MAKTIMLFVNKKKPDTLPLANEIRRVLDKRRYNTTFFFPDDQPSESFSGIDLCISLGGDGTVLNAARILAPLGIPVLPLNLGTLGFIAAIPPAQWEEAFSAWEAGAAIISRRLMLEVTLERAGANIFQSCLLNDAVISAAGIAKLVRLEVAAQTVSGDTIALGRFRADGLIVATPTGSTGYSVAAGGPIIDPEMEAMIINPICPFTLANRPMVLPSGDNIIVLVENEQRSNVLLTVDGQITRPLESGDRITMCRCTQDLALIASDRWAFYGALRTKLSWSGGEHHA